MEKTIKAFIYYDGRYYCAKCMEIDVFTQGKTIKEVRENLKEALRLILETNKSLVEKEVKGKTGVIREPIVVN